MDALQSAVVAVERALPNIGRLDGPRAATLADAALSVLEGDLSARAEVMDAIDAMRWRSAVPTFWQVLHLGLRLAPAHSAGLSSARDFYALAAMADQLTAVQLVRPRAAGSRWYAERNARWR